MKTYYQAICIAFLATVLCSNLQANAQSSGYHLIKKTVIGGEGGWDYLTVDHANNRLYLSHGNQVEVLDLATHKKLGVISSVNGVHGIVTVNTQGRGITTNGKSNTATLFDLKTLTPIAELATGKNPDALVYDSYSENVFVFNHSGASATAIDLVAGKVRGNIDLGGEGVEAGVSDGKGTIFVNLEDTHEIVSIDVKSLTVKSRWDISPGEEPTGLAIDAKTNRLFSVCQNALLIVVDATNGQIVTKVPIGKHADGVVFDPVTNLIISSNGEGSITIIKEISANDYSVIETIQTAPGARTLALDSATHHIFVTTAQYGDKPVATSANPNPRPSIVPGTFMVMEYGKN